MSQVHVIRHKVLVEGIPIWRVAREMGVSRNTVRKYLVESEPVRKPTQIRSRPVHERVASRIEELVEEWTPRTTPKQRITGTRIQRELRAEGLPAGTTLVREVLREIRRRSAEVFIPLVHRPGEEAQVDFFEVVVDVGGQRRKAWKFLVRLMYSGRDFAWLYDRCDQLAFLDGHVRAIEHFGAVAQRWVYDNLSAAVRKVTWPGRELTGRFQALVSHYLFEPCFARPGVGHDKGGVEARGKAIRLQHLTPVPQGASLEEISTRLLGDLERQASDKRDREGKSVLERFAQELPHMLVCPPTPFDPRKVLAVGVSRKAMVKVEGAFYSVPSTWADHRASALVGATTVEVVCRGERVTFARERFGAKRVRYRHYLPELGKKPQALRQVAPELLEELGEPYGELWRLLVDSHGPREAARILSGVLTAIVRHGEEETTRAVRSALSSKRMNLLALAPLLSSQRPKAIRVPESLGHFEVEGAKARDYDTLLLGLHADGETRHE